MPYITREDGEHFVIPSYRDVLIAENNSQLKKNILTLSQSYGEYITLQKISRTKYEIAFATETGYLLGESVWQHFKRPNDMIYCETVPNTTEAIFVIVKNGSVYLDGSFPLDSIAEELVVFLTQENNFEIYVYGDVPLSETAEEDKFSFEADSVKSFTKLKDPIFQRLPLSKLYKLQLVDVVLKKQRIGVFPTAQVVTLLVFLGLVWLIWAYLSDLMKPKEVAKPAAVVVNPYEAYLQSLETPDPVETIYQILHYIELETTQVGWSVYTIDYQAGDLHTQMRSYGGKVQDLIAFGNEHRISTYLNEDGILMAKKLSVGNRKKTKTIFHLNDILADMLDKIYSVYPGNNMRLLTVSKKDNYSVREVSIQFNNIPLGQLKLIADQLAGLPINLKRLELRLDSNSGNVNGSLLMEALGT